MFTNEAQAIVDQAKDAAASRREAELGVNAVATSLVMNRRGLHLLAECLRVEQGS